MKPISGKFLVLTLSLTSTAGLGLGAGVALVVTGWGSKSEIQALKRDVKKLLGDSNVIRSEMKSIRESLARVSPPRTRPTRVVSKVGIAGNPMLGKKDAPLTLIEFSDYQCPFCRRFFETTLGALKKDYIDTGKVRYVFRDFPLDGIHPQARKAAEAARCAGDQSKYWEMHDILFENKKSLGVGKLKEYARSIGVDPVAFDECLEKGKYTAEVQKDYKDGLAAGVRGTSGFFLGKSEPGGTIQGVLISGARPTRAFRVVIETLLREK